jgi:citrate lyase subunit beta/citryl-CoA lyase
MEPKLNIKMNPEPKFPRKSVLFVPALKVSFYAEALQSEADSIIFDLEDSIHPKAKDRARDLLLENYPRNQGGTKELIIRINGTRSPFFEEDVRTSVELHPHTICLPKTEGMEDIYRLQQALTASKSKSHHGPIGVIPLIESAKGFLKAEEALTCSRLISGTALGVEDLMAEFQIPREPLWRAPLLRHMVLHLSIVSRAYHIPHIGPVSREYNSADHLDIVEKESQFLRTIGCVGKLAIHPDQVNIINQVFSAKPMQKGQRRAILQQFDDAAERGLSVIGIDGCMLDEPTRRALISDDS